MQQKHIKILTLIYFLFSFQKFGACGGEISPQEGEWMSTQGELIPSSIIGTWKKAGISNVLYITAPDNTLKATKTQKLSTGDRCSFTLEAKVDSFNKTPQEIRQAYRNKGKYFFPTHYYHYNVTGVEVDEKSKEAACVSYAKLQVQLGTRHTELITIWDADHIIDPYNAEAYMRCCDNVQEINFTDTFYSSNTTAFNLKNVYSHFTFDQLVGLWTRPATPPFDETLLVMSDGRSVHIMAFREAPDGTICRLQRTAYIKGFQASSPATLKFYKDIGKALQPTHTILYANLSYTATDLNYHTNSCVALGDQYNFSSLGSDSYDLLVVDGGTIISPMEGTILRKQFVMDNRSQAFFDDNL